MAEVLNLATLPLDDIEQAFALAERLHKEGQLYPDDLSMILQTLSNPDELRERLVKAGIRAKG